MADSDSPSVPPSRRLAGAPEVVSDARALAVAGAPVRRKRAKPARASFDVEPPTASFFDSTTDAILRFDAQCRVVYANPALERAFALPRVNFIGQRLTEVEGFAEFAPLWEANLDDALQTLDSRWFKFGYPHPTGRKQFDVRMTVEVSRVRGATVATHITAVLRDVTVPREALRVSRAADDFVQTLLTAAPVGICLLDRELRYQAWNEALAALIGLSADDVLGRRPDEIPRLAANPDIMPRLREMRDGRVREPQTVEYQLGVAADGEPGPWLRVQRTPVFDRNGDFKGVFATTERLDRDRFAEMSLAALRQALDSAGEMVLQIDRGSRVIDANETALTWLGYTREQLTGMRLDQIDTRLSPELYAEMLEQLTGRGAWQGETRYRTRLGSEFPVDMVLQRVEQGGREFIFLLVRDITERKRIEQRLADAAWRFRTIFEESPVAKLLLGPDFMVTQANLAAGSLLGHASADLVGKPPSFIMDPLQHDAIDRLRLRLAKGAPSAAEGDRMLRHKDGHLVWGRLTLRAWNSGDGAAGQPRVRNYLLVLEDITERKISEEQLQVLLSDQQTLLETMSVGVVQASGGRILLANREFSRLFDYEDHEVVGMSLWELARDHANRMPHEVSGLPAVREGQTTSAEVVLFRRDGEPVWCLVQARPVAVSDPNHAEAIYTFQDVSEMKRQREALGRSLLELKVVLDTTAVGVLHLAGERVVRSNAQGVLQFGARPDAGERGAVAGEAPPGTGTDRDELAGRDVASLFAQPSDYEAHRAALQGLKDAAPFEVRLRGADGQPFWGLVTARAIDPASPAAGQIISVLDIDVRKRQEEQLQTLLAESRLMFDTALVGLLFVRDGRPLRANAAMEDLLACEPGAMTDQGQLFAHPTDQLLAASLAEHYDEIAAGGACEFELHMFRRRGDPIWVAVQGRAVNPDRPELGHIFAFVNVDERKRSERELLTALGELQLIFDNALVGMAYVADELVVKSNAATERMFGYGGGDLSELEIASLFADREDWDSLRAEAAVGEAEFERLMRRADGSTFWCAVNVRPLDPQMPERGLILALMDVDLRRRTADELKRMRNYLDLVVENLPVLVSVRDVETGRFTSLNRAGEQITGLAREQVIGRSWHEIYGRQFADLYAELDRRALATGQQVDRPRDVMLRADGRTLTVNQRVLPLYEPADDGSGALRARYVMSIIDDLTEEVRAEAALRETETRFRQFAENIDQLVFIATADLASVLYVNPRYKAVVGGPADELLDDGRNGLKYVHFDDVMPLKRKLPRLIAGFRRLRKAELTVRIDHPARGLRTLNLRLNPVRMFDGSVRVFGVADDITERAAAEQERIAEAVKQRDILVREVHHRIKNNLQGVAGLLQHMSTSKPEVAPQLNEIAGQIQAIAQVHGLQIRATGTLPVLGVAQGIVTNLANMFGADARFEQPAAGLWKWGLPEGEAVPLALVVNELGTNALKYRTSRDLPITVRVLPRPDGVELRIEQPGQLKAGFDLAEISSSVSGLGLVKALLPRRGARLAIEQQGATVVTRLELSPPAIREEL